MFIFSMNNISKKENVLSKRDFVNNQVYSIQIFLQRNNIINNNQIITPINTPPKFNVSKEF